MLRSKAKADARQGYFGDDAPVDGSPVNIQQSPTLKLILCLSLGQLSVSLLVLGCQRIGSDQTHAVR